MSSHARHRRWRRLAPALFLGLGGAGLSAAPTAAQPPQPNIPPVVDSLETPRAGMGDRVRIRTSGVVAARASRPELGKLVLFLDGRAMKGEHARLVDAAREVWEVRLRRDAAALDEWEAVLGRPRSYGKWVRVGLGPEAGTELPLRQGRPQPRLSLVIVRTWGFIATLLFWLAAILVFLLLAARTGILRDSVPPAPAPAPGVDPVPETPAQKKARRLEQPFSLARSQMAFWFFLILAAFLGIWLITGEYRGVLTEEAVWLMGIGSLTALGARLIEGIKHGKQEEAAERENLENTRAALDSRLAPDPARAAAAPAEERRLRTALAYTEARLAALDPAPPPVTPPRRGFFTDILQEDGDFALHRFQIVVWTLVLGVVFVVGAWQTLSLPRFDATLLILLGVSGGVYVLFKNAERQT